MLHELLQEMLHKLLQEMLQEMLLELLQDTGNAGLRGLYISICTEGRVRHFGFKPKSIKNRGDVQESARTNWRIPWFLSVGLKFDQKISYL